MLKQKKWYEHQCPYLLKPIFSVDPTDYCFIIENEVLRERRYRHE
jgi:hypothetical protein